MRALHLAVIGALLAIPSAAQAQDDAAVGGKVGPNLESAPAQPGSSSGAPYGSGLRAGPPAGYAGAVAPGQVVPQNVPVEQGSGGFGHALVNGHRVLIDPNSNRILRVFN